MAEAQTMYHVLPLDWSDQARLAAARAVIVEAFADADRYPLARIEQELQPGIPPFQRQFFVAEQVIAGETRIVGVGGIKAADWASGLHVLYLSAVQKAARGQGIGRALVAARLEWLRQQTDSGRVMVSTQKLRRFRGLGFQVISATPPLSRTADNQHARKRRTAVEDGRRYLMLLELHAGKTC